MFLTDPAQGISHGIVLTLLIFEGEIELHQLIYPSLLHGIHVGSGEEIHERVIINVKLEAMTQQIGLEMFDRPLHGVVIDLHTM